MPNQRTDRLIDECITHIVDIKRALSSMLQSSGLTDSQTVTNITHTHGIDLQHTKSDIRELCTILHCQATQNQQSPSFRHLFSKKVHSHSLMNIPNYLQSICKKLAIESPPEAIAAANHIQRKLSSNPELLHDITEKSQKLHKMREAAMKVEALTKAAGQGDCKTVEQLITDGAELKYDDEGFGLAETAAYEAWRAWGHAHPDDNMSTITKGLADPKGIYCELQAIVKTVQFLTCARLWDYAEKGDLERIKIWHQDMTQGSGKTLGLNINASNAQGDTALTIAAKHGNKEVIKWLVTEGSANIAHTKNKDQTALAIYQESCDKHGHQPNAEMIALLKLSPRPSHGGGHA